MEACTERMSTSLPGADITPLLGRVSASSILLELNPS